MLGRHGYSALLYALSPLIWKRLKRERLPDSPAGERRGHIPDYHAQQTLWVHAASVGEVITAAPVIRQMRADYPSHTLVVTTMTATGAERVKSLFGNSVVHHFLPIDYPGAMKRFVRSLSPELLVLAETELWPNMLYAASEHNVPVVMINARLSDKAFSRYARFHQLTRDMLIRINWIAAKSGEDAKRFRSLGVPPKRISVAGALKFDLTVSDKQRDTGAALRQQIGQRPVWIAASTHEGEEQAVLEAHRQLLKVKPEALLLLVPRHPQRFDDVAKACGMAFPAAVARRSHDDAITTATRVYVGDTMGELIALYAASDIAFVGGTLVPVGGHNLLEPAALGVPVLSGPHVNNLQEIADVMAAHQARREVNDALTLGHVLIELFSNDQSRQRLGETGRQVVERNKGASILIRDRIRAMVPVDEVVSGVVGEKVVGKKVASA